MHDLCHSLPLKRTRNHFAGPAKTNMTFTPGKMLPTGFSYRMMWALTVIFLLRRDKPPSNTNKRKWKKKLNGKSHRHRLQVTAKKVFFLRKKYERMQHSENKTCTKRREKFNVAMHACATAKAGALSVGSERMSTWDRRRESG